MKPANTVESMIDTIYPGISAIPPDHQRDKYFLERTILSARNDDVDELNQMLLDKCQGEEKKIHRADSLV
ncbi:hypothetical protein B0H19DRAFT_889192, partial [Mycena capillaripes]